MFVLPFFFFFVAGLRAFTLNFRSDILQYWESEKQEITAFVKGTGLH